MVTRFGDVVVSRRMYRDSDGRTVFALHDYLGQKPRQLASPSITQSVVEMATEMALRKVSDTVSALTAGELSSRTTHRLLQSVGEGALAEERERWEAQFERGEDVSEGCQRADILYTEADGVWIHLQREKRRHHELKSATAYRGWRRVAGDRYELVGKRVYTHGDDAVPFWEGASMEWAKQYALDEVKLFVVGGDGANWIGRGADELGNAIFQLDGFHLSRACGRGYGSEIGSAIYDAIRSGSHRYARALMSAAEPAESTTASSDRQYVESNMYNGVDWRNRVSNAPLDARSLGTMESNGDKLTAKPSTTTQLTKLTQAPNDQPTWPSRTRQRSFVNRSQSPDHARRIGLPPTPSAAIHRRSPPSLRSPQAPSAGCTKWQSDAWINSLQLRAPSSVGDSLVETAPQFRKIPPSENVDTVG